jgi:hypothetical protein
VLVCGKRRQGVSTNAPYATFIRITPACALPAPTVGCSGIEALPGPAIDGERAARLIALIAVPRCAAAFDTTRPLRPARRDPSARHDATPPPAQRPARRDPSASTAPGTTRPLRQHSARPDGTQADCAVYRLLLKRGRYGTPHQPYRLVRRPLARGRRPPARRAAIRRWRVRKPGAAAVSHARSRAAGSGRCPRTAAGSWRHASASRPCTP